MRVTLVHNPGAGDESHSAKRILKRLTDAGHDATLGSTGKRGISKALEDPGRSGGGSGRGRDHQEGGSGARGSRDTAGDPTDRYC